MAYNNSDNQNVTGILTLSSSGASTGSTVTQNGVLYGGASNAVSSTAVGATGTVLIGNTAAAPSFSATPTVTSITFGSGTALNTYAEGTWTPTLSFGGASVGITYAGQAGTYTKIGRVVYIQGEIDLSNKGSSTGNALLSGFPFTTANLSFAWAANFNNMSGTTATALMMVIPVPSTTTASFFQSNTTGASPSILTNTSFTNTSYFYFCGFYST